MGVDTDDFCFIALLNGRYGGKPLQILGLVKSEDLTKAKGLKSPSVGNEWTRMRIHSRRSIQIRRLPGYTFDPIMVKE